ncbi:dynein regulatory complex subunit 3-like [Euwallacea fornicatus]|uniref:dynein regulatory complex subunit 3-like n=1 Tax=Euwallacea fornicatus TaxID=995702 RepID=UPI00338FA72D
MINPCKEREPRVIDNDLIAKCIELQYPKGEVGRLLGLEGIPLEEVEEIRFEYLYILRIDHLWALKSLVKLSLNNNFIEKIENLETLIHLRELNLSFNRIKKIENLQCLVNLEKVTFYENLIETVENMDNQTKMTIFSIGKNRISDKTCISYFRRFEALTSLNMAGNPCAEDLDFRLYVAALLPTLVYYEYKRITVTERADGSKEFQESLKKLETVESREKEQRDAIERELKDVKLHSKMFVEYLNTGRLFEAMYEDDEEGKALLEIGDEVNELYDEYKTQFIGFCQQIFTVGEKHYNTRKTEVEKFEKCVQKAKSDNQTESIRFMESFLEKRDRIFSDTNLWKLQLEHNAITEDVFECNIEEQRKVFEELIHFTWKHLMRLEVTLFEQVDEVNQIFSQVLEEMINDFIEEARELFTNIRAAEVTYSENLNDIALRFMTALNVNPDEEVAECLFDIIFDQNALTNAMSATHDVHMHTIDSREDQLVAKARGWLENLSCELEAQKIKRNRDKIFEINHFLDVQREKFVELTNDHATTVNIEEVVFDHLTGLNHRLI